MLVFFFVLIQSTYVFFFQLPMANPGETANFTSAYDTLSNSRLSYRAGVASGSLGSSVVTIATSGNADNDTNHLFPNDVVCFTDTGLNGCIGQATYTVANVIDAHTFNITPPLANNLIVGGYVIATQSAIHTVTFTTTNAVPSNGNILLTIPAVDANNITHDGFPDTNSSVTSNGFDVNTLSTSNVTVASTGCANNWTVSSVTPGTATSDTTILINRNTDSCAGSSTITVTVGDTNKKLINPAPITSGHTQGVADVYGIGVQTRDGSNNTLDQNTLKVAVLESVLVSATVQETLSLTVAGVATSNSTCGQTTGVTSTATSVPWGTISNFGAFNNAAQTVTVSTNAASGYAVKVEENDQMGKDGKVCPGASAGEAQQCIQDTTCNATGCSYTTSQDWTGTTYYGLGYSLANVTGTDAAFTYNESSRTFSAKDFPDQEASLAKQTIMSNAGPVASNEVYVCYRLNVSATQPAGYYFNVVKYTATATF